MMSINLSTFITLVSSLATIIGIGCTQHDKNSYIRIIANSNKFDFYIDLENVGPSLAKIIKVELKERRKTKIWLKNKKRYKKVGEWPPLKIKLTRDDIYDYKSRSFSNIKGDVIGGNGTKHHLFRCTVSDLDSLKQLWRIIKDYKIVVTYRDASGLFTEINRKCESHFDRDYYSFKVALGSRTCFSDNKMN